MKRLHVDSVPDLLQLRAIGAGGRRAFSFLVDGESIEDDITYEQLDWHARAFAAHLQGQAFEGTHALLVLPPGLPFVSAFFGCLYAGVTAIPTYPPRPHRPSTRVLTIVRNSRPAIALTTTKLLNDLRAVIAANPELSRLRWLTTDTGNDESTVYEAARRWRPPAVGPDTLALIQYTSGSTSIPKGVMITHANLLHNSEQIHRCFGTSPASRGVFWLPPYHDMGLIGGILQTIYCGGFSTLLSPWAFAQKPLRWLQAISRTGADISGGPNFAYDLCTRAIPPERRADLDLSRWRVVLNGAELVRSETMRRFADAFAACGFCPESIRACYGLAEATLLVSGGQAGPTPAALTVRASALAQNHVIPAAQGDPESKEVVSCGPPVAGQTVAVVDPETITTSPEGRVGEIWVAGASVAQGYWNQPDESERSFGARIPGDERGPFLRTGDLGFLHDGQLYVTGRMKDLIIVRGRNHYPQDIERAAEESHSSLRRAANAAFSVTIDDEEQVVVAQEVDRGSNYGAVLDAVTSDVLFRCEVDLHGVVLLRAGTIPRTSSGKIQRHLCRDGFLNDRLNVVAARVREEARPVSEIAAGDGLSRTAATRGGVAEQYPADAGAWATEAEADVG